MDPRQIEKIERKAEYKALAHARGRAVERNRERMQRYGIMPVSKSRLSELKKASMGSAYMNLSEVARAAVAKRAAEKAQRKAAAEAAAAARAKRKPR